MTIQLIGSEKQVAWANDIREKSVAKWNGKIAHFEAEDPEYWGETIAEMRKFVARALENSSARDWIDSKAGPMVLVGNRIDGAAALGMDERTYWDICNMLGGR